MDTQIPACTKSSFWQRIWFWWDFITLLNDFDIKYVLTKIKSQQANALVERWDQVILDMLVTKYIANKVFEYIYPWGETLAYI